MDSTGSTGAESAGAVALGLLDRPAGAETPGAFLAEDEDDSGLEAADVSILRSGLAVVFKGAEAGAREVADFPAGLPGRPCSIWSNRSVSTRPFETNSRSPGCADVGSMYHAVILAVAWTSAPPFGAGRTRRVQTK